MNRAPRSGTQTLAGAAVVVPARAPVTVRIAGAELSRCLYLLTGRVSPVVSELPTRGTAVVLDRKTAAALGVGADRAGLGEQGYRLAVAKQGRRQHVVVGACKPPGVFYGVYGLLEMLGMGFYAGGETFPESPAGLPAGLDVSVKPAFAVRGNMLHYNFLCGCTNWGLPDYKFYFDQLARMRCNMLLMHWYDCEPGAAHEIRGEYLPAYWQTIERLETCMPAAPPRELQARGLADEVWLSWQPDRRAGSQNLYRRREGSKAWTRANRKALSRGCEMFIDRPARPGDYLYAATAVDESGGESPMSHPVRARCGPGEAGPTLVAVKPPARLAAGEGLGLRIVAVSDRGVKAVGAAWRMAGERRWHRTPLTLRFRDSWHGAVDGTLLSPGIVEFYVTAEDGDGNGSSWPASAPALPWTAMII